MLAAALAVGVPAAPAASAAPASGLLSATYVDGVHYQWRYIHRPTDTAGPWQSASGRVTVWPEVAHWYVQVRGDGHCVTQEVYDQSRRVVTDGKLCGSLNEASDYLDAMGSAPKRI